MAKETRVSSASESRVTSVSEVQRMESDVITMQELFKFHIDEITADGTIVGGLRTTGLRPSFVSKFEKRGIPLPQGLFQSSHLPVNAAIGLARS